VKKKLLSLILVGLGISCTTYIPGEIIRDLSSIQTDKDEEVLPDIEPVEPVESQNIAPIILKENPPDGEEIAPNNDIPIIWSFIDPDGPELLTFTIEFDTDRSFESPDLRTFTETEPNNQIWFPTSPNNIYYWRVHVTDGVVTTTDEEIFSFKVLDN